jgi:hypothetical protein
LKDTSNICWTWDANAESMGVIPLTGIWGYHNRYTLRGWYAATTLSGAEDATTDTWAVADGSAITQDMIVRVDNELAIVESCINNSIVVYQRGENGSTAATHDNGSTVYVWRPMPDIRQAAMEIAKNARDRRWGPNESGTSSVTPGGLVISPSDITKTAYQTISRYRRRW